MEPGTYAQNQVIEAGTYLRSELEEFAPGPLPESVAIQPGQSPSMLEQILSAAGGLASTVPGGQPFGVALLGLAGIGKIWRDRRKIKDLDRGAKTLSASVDSIKDVFASLPDRELGRKLESELDKHISQNAGRLKAGRDLIDAILSEMATPTKQRID
ncbi:hypothetical protein DDZ13_06615 [Coraliomargarita sinensis]|uniref:Uncharacterized protein n=2 Tax=Coraliomargarita sinensis TaxID=2174842 RepID=A0A317ZIP1_9BACT|nr:hypothetical protein DDZ13_06615 [Coraliomargarita sinensis]